MLAALCAVAFGLVSQNRSISSSAPLPYAPIASGTEVVMVFLASSTCPGIHDASLREALRLARDSLAEEARLSGKGFVVVGVSLDWNLESGYRLLERFGPFDEVLIGRSWLNSGAVRYLWSDFPGIAAVPQLVVLERVIDKDRSISIRDERVRFRKAGAPVIVNWANAAYRARKGVTYPDRTADVGELRPGIP
jgi:hypothetical protein